MSFDKKPKRRAGRRRAAKATQESSRTRRRKAPAGQIDPLAGSLVEFLRRSPLAGVSLDLERDRSAGRDIDLD